jgi:hypothetical protein
LVEKSETNPNQKSGNAVADAFEWESAREKLAGWNSSIPLYRRAGAVDTPR